MKLTKLEHSGLLIEDHAESVVCDPVEFEHKLPELSHITAIIITHKHGDHYQSEVLQRILAKNPHAKIFAPQDLDDDKIANHPVEKVSAEVEWDLGNFNLKFFGQDHAAIVTGQTPCANLGVIINDKIVNPGDSFDLPTGMKNIELLCVPNAAPWLKIAESMNYIRETKPKFALPVHNALLSPLGEQVANNWLKIACDDVNTKLIDLKIDENIEIA